MPLGETPTVVRAPLLTLNLNRGAPLSASHTAITLSLPAVTNRRQSNDQEQEVTLPLCAAGIWYLQQYGNMAEWQYSSTWQYGSAAVWHYSSGSGHPRRCSVWCFQSGFHMHIQAGKAS